MNIFEELAESYTFNGVVSLKALNDDIVTLENQIDSYNTTLRELQLRGRKVNIIIGKIRDAKIRLSLLKAVYKKESDKATPDDVILNMLGISAKNAKEVASVGTAADGRKPKPQNFESAELEEIAFEEGTEVKATENEKVVDKKIAVTEKGEPDAQTAIIENNTTNNETIVANKNTTEQGLNEFSLNLTSKGGDTVGESETVVAKNEEQEETIGYVIDITDEATYNESEYLNVQSHQTQDEKDMKGVSVEKIMEEQETKSVKEEKNTSGEYLNPINETDDYHEQATSQSHDGIICDEDVAVYGREKENEIQETQELADDDTDYGTPGEVVLNEEPEACEETKAYDAFYWPDNKIYVSFDLCGYTDMVNTNSITGTFNHKYKVIELTFTDVLDYSIFAFLMDEKNNKRPFFDRFRKKQKSIIMYVRTEIDGVEKEYRYEFTGCRLVDVFDTEYKSMRDSDCYPTSTHEFYAKFKYKRLKIN